MNNYDVVVIGAGNAALSAALSAKDNGAKKIFDRVYPNYFYKREKI